MENRALPVLDGLKYAFKSYVIDDLLANKYVPHDI